MKEWKSQLMCECRVTTEFWAAQGTAIQAGTIGGEQEKRGQKRKRGEEEKKEAEMLGSEPSRGSGGDDGEEEEEEEEESGLAVKLERGEQRCSQLQRRGVVVDGPGKWTWALGGIGRWKRAGKNSSRAFDSLPQLQTCQNATTMHNTTLLYKIAAKLGQITTRATVNLSTDRTPIRHANISAEV
ncbi:hypothetical protein Dda_7470 [Drechslerella dactyloides]|uniref:Uncharacterized protein n=1 Tax=Drechslerella dactyloides TaxID=74499 RepID=A0AAD6IWI8_DREDA|nr:hypothetical protein Dda_7470 [Drechslerella dactyloides]